MAELADLGLNVAGIVWGERGVKVAGHLQSTTNPAVWAAGDSADTAGMPPTPVAVLEAKVASSNMIKGTTTIPDYTGIPTAVFTIPELTRVGMLEAEARECRRRQLWRCDRRQPVEEEPYATAAGSGSRRG